MSRAWKDWQSAHLAARKLADTTGLSVGIERNRVTREWVVFFLPSLDRRYGHEVRCEVVNPDPRTRQHNRREPND